ncbi:hypothetical protein [Sphingomicrobium arenosum]|uniref:hypothetical protein n=1 Tax=Sphingomicrobium arenosum TaxID=2233861 RepID=UPI00223F1877|nr:hypothetical protein [Sphingomicrobium arenosum]
MSGPQFVHMETYAMSVSSLRQKREIAMAKEGKVKFDRRLNVEEICHEAARTPGSHPHVDEPLEPRLLFGVDPVEVPDIIQSRLDEHKVRQRERRRALPRGQRRGVASALRKDAQVLVAMVASYPVPWVEEKNGELVANFQSEEEKALLQKWNELTIAWGHQQCRELGLELVSVVEHFDEGHPHLHLLAVAAGENPDVRSCHPGRLAKDAVERNEGETDREHRARGDRAYKDAMQAFQQRYYDDVSQEVGLLRHGPKRFRLGHNEYKEYRQAQKAAAAAKLKRDQAEAGLAQAQVERKRLERRLADVKIDLEIVSEGLAAKREEKGQQERLRQQLLSSVSRLQGILEEDGRMRDRMIQELDELKEAREIEERSRDEAEAEKERALAEIQSERARLHCERESVELEKKKLDREKRRVASIFEGLRAYAAKTLKYVEKEGGEAALVYEGKDAGAQKRLDAVASDLRPIIGEIHNGLMAQVTKAIRRVRRAMGVALKAWGQGMLSVDKSQADGPRLVVGNSAEAKALTDQIKPYTTEAATVVAALPDPGKLVEIYDRMAAVKNILTEAEYRQYVQLNDAIQQSSHKGR